MAPFHPAPWLIGCLFTVGVVLYLIPCETLSAEGNPRWRKALRPAGAIVMILGIALWVLWAYCAKAS